MRFTAEDATTLLALTSQWENVYRITVEEEIWLAHCPRTGDVITADNGPELKIKLADHYRGIRQFARATIQEDSASL
jgi:hypothetical protein